MITAEKLQTLTTFTHNALQVALGKKAKDYEFTKAYFQGITNGGQFCYLVNYKTENGTDSTKVFLTYDAAAGKVTVDF